MFQKIWNVLLKLRKTFCGSIAKNSSKALNEKKKKIWQKETKIFPKTIISPVFLPASRYFVGILNILLCHWIHIIRKWSLFIEMYCIVLNKFYYILFRRLFQFKILKKKWKAKTLWRRTLQKLETDTPTRQDWKLKLSVPLAGNQQMLSCAKRLMSFNYCFGCCCFRNQRN